MTYSSLGKRFLAHIIDTMVVNLLTIWFIDYYFVGVIVSSILVFIIYNVLMMGSSWHATLGQRALGMCVVDRNGNGIDYARAVGRTFAFWLSSLLCGFGHVIALFTNEKQTLQDKLAETYVVDNVPDVLAPKVNYSNNTIAKITCVSGEKAGTTYIIQGNGIMIGRDPTVCQVVLNHSAGISRLHCFVSYNSRNGMYILYDRNSTYGTFTQNGTRVHPTSSLALKSGERFYLGSPQTMFEVG